MRNIWQVRIPFAFFCFVLAIVTGAAIVSAQEEIGGALDMKYPYHSAPNRVPASAFAGSDAISNAKLSPDGTHMLAAFARQNDVLIQAIAIQPEKTETHFTFPTASGSLDDAHWLDNRRILIQTRQWRFDRKAGFIPTMMLRVFERDKAGAIFVRSFDIRRRQAFVANAILDTLPKDPDHILISISEDGRSSPGVYKLNIVDGTMQQVEAPRDGVSVWMTDADGDVRLGFGTDDDKFRMIAKPTKSSAWVELHNKELFQDGRFFPVRFGFDGKTLIVRSAVANGRFAFYRFSLTEGRITDKIFEHPSVDVLGLEVSPNRKTLLAVTYMEDKLKRHFLDEHYHKLFDAIDHALPGRSNYLMSQNGDGRYFLIKSVSDRYPGAVYRLDTQTNEMEVVSEINPRIDPRLLSPTTRVNYYARDGLEIPAYLTRPIAVSGTGKLPAIILPHDGPAGRDTAEYDRMAQFFASRGYLVLQPNYRGSSGYSFEFQALGIGEWGGKIQDDIEDAAKYLISDGLADPKHICIAGDATFGAYSALLGVLKTPDLFACAVAISPIPDLDAYSDQIEFWLGRGAARAIKGRRSSKAVKAASPVTYAEGLSRPLLLFYGGQDWWIPPKKVIDIDEKFRKSGAPYKLLFGRSEGHGISETGNRAAFYEAMDKFLAQYLGQPDESGFVLERRKINQDTGALIASAKARADRLDDSEVLARCVPSHYRPFLSIPPAGMAAQIGYCSAYLDGAAADTSPQTLVTARLTRAKLYYLKGNYAAFEADLDVAKALAAKAGDGAIDIVSRYAIRVLDCIRLDRNGDPAAALKAAVQLSDEAPDYLSGHQVARMLTRKQEAWPEYLRARERELSLAPIDFEADSYVNALMALQKLKAAREIAAAELLFFPSPRIRTGLLLFYLEASLKANDLKAAAPVVAAFENPEAATKAGTSFPGYPALKFATLEIALRNVEQRRLKPLLALYYFEAGQPDKAKAIVPTEVDACGNIICWKINQHFAKLAGKDVEVKSLQHLIDHHKDYPPDTFAIRHPWQERIIRALPALPLAALGGHKTPPAYRREVQNGNGYTLFFEAQAATDEYSFWQALSAKAERFAREKGAVGYVVLNTEFYSVTDLIVNAGDTYANLVHKETKLEIELLTAEDLAATPGLPAWMLHRVH